MRPPTHSPNHLRFLYFPLIDDHRTCVGNWHVTAVASAGPKRGADRLLSLCLDPPLDPHCLPHRCDRPSSLPTRSPQDLHCLATALIDRETLTKPQIEAILRGEAVDTAVPGEVPPEATVPPGSEKAGVGEAAGVGEEGDGEVAASMAAANEEHS